MVDSDPWGRPYKAVMARLKGPTTASPSSPVLLQQIVTTLFPKQPELTYGDVMLADHRLNVPTISEEEMMKACSKIGDAKAPGPDGVPNVALKAAIRSRPELFLKTYNTCLAEGIFPTRWKLQKLVLLPKGNKPPEDPSSYRPICLLDTAGKVLERIICNRMEEFSEGDQGLSQSQYGFRKARSTTDAITVVVDTARKAIEGKRWRRGAKKYCAIVTLDVRNAFNSANWDRILDALRSMEFPEYIRRLILSYFSDRTLRYNTDAGPQTYNITGGVPQGSVLGPLLWNVMYDGVLRLPMPAGTRIVGFADDIAVVVVAKHLEEVTQIANEAIATIRQWLSSSGLHLADQKTEAVLVSSRKARETITFTIGGCNIVSQPSVRYLGVHIDDRLRFNEHLQIVSARARATSNALSRIMPNIGGPRQIRRRLLSSVVSSIMLYGAPVWSDALVVTAYARQITSVYRRSALRVARAFHTVSYDAVCVIADMMPIHLMAEERTKIYRRRREDQETDRRAIAKEIRTEMTMRWQQLWDASTKGRWTHRLISDIHVWSTRKHGEVDHYITQLLTGHGCFKAYQHRFRLDDDASCPVCQPEHEDAEHVFFRCPRFHGQRLALQRYLRHQLSPENIVGEMLSSEATWEAVGTFAADIIKELRREERRRKGQTQA